MARDARLQFLRRVLQKIKQNAEEMGLEGTMQVSVIEVDPHEVPEILANAVRERNNGEQAPRPVHVSPSEDPRSDAFLDSFGEFHAPNPFAGVRPAENSVQEVIPAGPGRMFGSWNVQPFEQMHVPFLPPFFRPEVQEISFRPPPPVAEWAFQRPETEQFEFRQPEMPKSGESNQEVMGEIYGRKFGRMLQDLIAARLQSHFMQPFNPLLRQQQQQQRPSFPIEQQPQQSWWEAAQQQQVPQVPQPAQAVQQWPEIVLPQAVPMEQQAQQQAQQAQQHVEQVFQERNEAPAGQPQPPQPQPLITESAEAQPPAIHPPRADVQQQAQRGQDFPQPSQQFPVFIPTEDRIQIEPNSAWNQINDKQQPVQVQPSQQGQQAPVIDFFPLAPPAWTHNSEPQQTPSTPSTPASMVDGEVHQERKDSEESSPELVILRKPLDAERTHEDVGPSQLADLPLKELQGELAAAAAALAQQHAAVVEQDKKEAAEQQKPEQAEQQPVEPASIQAEQPAEEKERVDFPAVKFPQADAADKERPHIFFQVDEPQPQFGAGHV